MKKIVLAIVFMGMLSGAYAEDCIMAEELHVNFKNSSTVYANDMEENEIKNFAKFLKKSGLYTLIEGHTSSLALAKYNYELSTARVLKVRGKLIELGVAPERVRAMGYGESSPLYNNKTQEGAKKNRRVVAEVFNSAEELGSHVESEKERVKDIRLQEHM